MVLRQPVGPAAAGDRSSFRPKVGGGGCRSRTADGNELVIDGDGRAGPRAVLFEGSSSRTASTRARWDTHERGVLTLLRGELVSATGEVAEPWIVWRLLSANNRELGRGVGAFPSSSAARAAVERVIGRADQLDSASAFALDRGQHAWALRLADDFVVIAPRWHRSRRANRENLTIAIESLRHARLSTVVTLLSR